MKKTGIKLLIISYMFLFSACATTQYSVKPLEEPTLWNQGVGYNQRSQNGVTYSVGPGEIVDGGIQFNAQIENNGANAVNMNSQIFSLNNVRAENPEILLNKMDKLIADRKGQYDPMGANLLTTISDMGNRSDEAKARSQKSDEELKRMESDVKELQMQKEKIASRFLRLTTLKPGQSVSGLVQFPLSSSSKASGQQMVLKNSAVSAPANTLLFQILKVQ